MLCGVVICCRFYGASGVEALQRRFRWMGILNLILMPFIMIFMVIFFFLKHAEELHSSKSVMGPRQWTPLVCVRLLCSPLYVSHQLIWFLVGCAVLCCAVLCCVVLCCAVV
jgi:hypothetical protein